MTEIMTLGSAMTTMKLSRPKLLPSKLQWRHAIEVRRGWEKAWTRIEHSFPTEVLLQYLSPFPPHYTADKFRMLMLAWPPQQVLLYASVVILLYVCPHTTILGLLER